MRSITPFIRDHLLPLLRSITPFIKSFTPLMRAVALDQKGLQPPKKYIKKKKYKKRLSDEKFVVISHQSRVNLAHAVRGRHY